MPNPRRHDAGSALLEHVAALGLSAILLTIPITALAGQPLADKVDQVVCAVSQIGTGSRACPTVAGGSDESSGADPTGDPVPPVEHQSDPKPEKCKKKEHEEETSTKVSLGFISLGKNRALVKSTFSDGSVELTVTDGAEIEAAGGFGGHLDIGKLQAGASVDLGAGLKVGYGSTWVAKDAEEADELESQVRQWINWSELPVVAPRFNARPVPPPKPPPPAMSVRSLEVKAGATGSLGFSLPGGEKNSEGDHRRQQRERERRRGG